MVVIVVIGMEQRFGTSDSLPFGTLPGCTDPAVSGLPSGQMTGGQNNHRGNHRPADGQTDSHRAAGETGAIGLRDGNGILFGHMDRGKARATLPCFTPGTLIATPLGERPVEELREGDPVLTRDNGFQPIRWVGRRELSVAELAANPALRPVHFAKGALGANGQDRAILVSPDHRMLLVDPEIGALFGDHEVLVPARHFLGRKGVTRMPPAPVSYIHLLFDRHEILLGNGAWSESFQPGAATLAGADPAQGPLRASGSVTLFPLAEGEFPFETARRSLCARESRVMRVA